MFEIYAFCRAGRRHRRFERPARANAATQLERWRADIDALYDGRPIPRTQGLVGAGRAISRCEREDFLAIIDGMEMDVVADIRAPDDATLDLYCDRVASAVGRLSVRVFGMAERDGVALAHHLGRALQLTNILRDLDEDAAIGRLYLPREGIARTPASPRPIPRRCWRARRSASVCARLVERARAHFAQADAIMARSPRRTVRAPRIMGEAYRLILDSLVDARLVAARAARSACRARGSCGSSCGTPSSDDRCKAPFTSSAPGLPALPLRCGLQQRGAHVVVHEAAGAGRRTLPLLSRSARSTW